MQRFIFGSLMSLALAAAIGCPATDTTAPPSEQPPAEQPDDQQAPAATEKMDEPTGTTPAIPSPESAPQNP